MENQRFRDIVDQKKHKQVGNISLDMIGYSDRGDIKPEDFFSGKEINIQSFREFFVVNKYDEAYINKKLPKVVFEKRKQEILKNIELQKVTNPVKLVELIAEYIKGLIKYDIVEAIYQLNMMGQKLIIKGNNIDNKELIIDSAIDTIRDYTNFDENKIGEIKQSYKGMEIADIVKHLYKTIYSELDTNQNIIMGEKEYQIFKNKVNHILDTKNLSEKEKITIMMKMGNLPEDFLVKLQRGLFADTHTYKDFKTNFKKLLLEQRPEEQDEFISNFHNFFGKFIIDDIIRSNGEYELADKLYKSKIGVCRDYSIMIKIIYKELAKELFPDSEVLYVLNPLKAHTYNCLVFKNKKGEIEYKYFDLTRYINGGSLFINKEEKQALGLDSKYEILVQKDLDNLKNEIENGMIG